MLLLVLEQIVQGCVLQKFWLVSWMCASSGNNYNKSFSMREYYVYSESILYCFQKVSKTLLSAAQNTSTILL